MLSYWHGLAFHTDLPTCRFAMMLNIPVKEGVSKLGERAELLFGIHDEGVTRHHTVRIRVHHSNKPEELTL